MPKLGIEIKRKCKFCGKAFIIKTLDSIYCCKKCSEAAYAQKKRAEAKEKKLALIGFFRYLYWSFLFFPLFDIAAI